MGVGYWWGARLACMRDSLVKHVMISSLNSRLKVSFNINFSRELLTTDATRCAYLLFSPYMHNYNDATCIQILKSHLPAMGPTNRILIDEKTLPDDKPKVSAPSVEYTVALSLAMKALFDAQERREAHWRRLMEQVGLEIVEIRKFTRYDDISDHSQKEVRLLAVVDSR